MAERIPHPPRKGPGEPEKVPAKDKQLIKLSTITRTVINAVANDQFEYNCLLVKTKVGNLGSRPAIKTVTLFGPEQINQSH